MVRVIAHSLGSDGSVMYRSAAGDFFLYPSLVGWRVEHEVPVNGAFVLAGQCNFSERRGALAAIERASLHGGSIR